MKDYQCPGNPDHIGVLTEATNSKSPHRARIICEECGIHIKWASQQDIIRINDESAENAEIQHYTEAGEAFLEFAKQFKVVTAAMRKAGLI